MKLHPNIQRAENAAAFQKVVDFCASAGAPHCYQNWSRPVLEDYVRFHMHQRTFSWTRHRGKIVGTGVAWQCCAADIRAAAAAGRLFFNWQPTDPEGDAVFFADFIATMPGALPALLHDFAKRYPHWTNLKWFTFRVGGQGTENLVEINIRYAARVFKAGGIYGRRR